MAKEQELNLQIIESLVSVTSATWNLIKEDRLRSRCEWNFGNKLIEEPLENSLKKDLFIPRFVYGEKLNADVPMVSQRIKS